MDFRRLSGRCLAKGKCEKNEKSFARLAVYSKNIKDLLDVFSLQFESVLGFLLFVIL
jgi:hypothetical protein